MVELISVIVPVYNVEKYLSKCIDSIITQTYRNLEIILVDDGSQDKSGEICDNYAKKDTRIRVIHKENGGVSDARNVGVENSRGDYITFVDSDDFISPHYCEIMMNNIDTADVLQAYMYSVTPLRNIKINRINKKMKICSTSDIINTYYFNKRLIPPVLWGKLYRKHVFSCIKFPIGRIFEDGSVLYKILECCKEIIFIPDCIYYWRETENSITHTKNKNYYIDGIKVCQEQALYFREKNRELSNSLYIHLFDHYISSYIELTATRNDVKNEIVQMLKKDNEEIGLSLLEDYQRELIQDILMNQNSKRIKKLIFEFKKERYIAILKSTIKKVVSCFVKNRDF